MNRIAGLVVVALSLVVLTQAGLASEQGNCKRTRGNFVEVFNPANNAATGVLSNGGWLDGTTEAVFNSAAYPTPDPNKVTFSSTMTITTDRGELKGARVYLFDFVTGQGVDITNIDPVASTGRFAGATGVLYVNLIKSITVAEGPYVQVVEGRICFARHEHQ